jgi:hypothetical protein
MQEITARGFNRIELLVHPFFALENIRKKGEANSVTNMTEKEALLDYEYLGLVKNWERKLKIISKNPHAIMIIAGPQEMESSPYVKRNFFFTGRLTPKKLKTFSKAYQDFLHNAKKILGKRLIYISNGIEGREYYLQELLLKRRLVPLEKVSVYAYGEYLGKNKPQCVDVLSNQARDLINTFQRRIPAHKNPQVEVVKKAQIKTSGQTTQISMETQNDFPSMQRAEIMRRLTNKGRVTKQFMMKRFGFNAKSAMHETRTINSAWRKARPKRPTAKH